MLITQPSRKSIIVMFTIADTGAVVAEIPPITAGVERSSDARPEVIARSLIFPRPRIYGSVFSRSSLRCKN